MTVSPTRLCRTANVAGPNTIWSSPSSPCPDRTGGVTTGCVLALTSVGTVSPSIWEFASCAPLQAATSGSRVEQLDGLGWDVVARVEHVVPVPPVERRRRHQGVQTARETEGGDQQRDGQDGSQQRRAHRHGGATPTRLEREAHPHDARHRHSRGFGTAGDARPSSRSPTRSVTPDAVRRDRRTRPRPIPGRRPAPRTRAEDRPVEGDPRIGIDGPHRPEGGERGEPHRHCDGQPASRGARRRGRRSARHQPRRPGRLREPEAPCAPRLPTAVGARSPVSRAPRRRGRR